MVYVVWGEPEEGSRRVLACRDKVPDNVVAIVPDRSYASVNLGFTVVAGPIISDPDDAGTAIVVFADQLIPDWCTPERLAAAGWDLCDELPAIVRVPFQVDLLVLASSWHGSLDGWSSTVWLDSAVRPMQRIRLQISPISPARPLVHVLETGADPHGVGFAVVFTPDRDELERSGLSEHGWRSEPWVRMRRPSWTALASLSSSVEAHVSLLLGHPVVRKVTIHDLVGMHADGFKFLPVDVRDALEEALLELPD